MTLASADAFARHAKGSLHVSRLRLIMFLCLFDLAAPFLMLFQVVGVNLVVIVPTLQPIIFLMILTTMQRPSRAAILAFAALAALVTISLFKSFSLAGIEDYNFTFRAAISYYYSIAMPCLVCATIFSQKKNDPDVVYKELIWFSRSFFYISIPIILVYFVLHMTGRFPYFGFGINFHYFAPFFFHKNMYILGMVVLILLSGKRSVLVNFLVQLGLYFSAALRRNPLPVVIVLSLATAAAIFAGENLAFLLRRFQFMIESYREADWSEGIFGLADTYQSMILFGGRLEEVTGVLRYFEKHPGQIWFGAPPGANYLWKIELYELFMYKSFTHLNWIAYVFRYGVIPSMFLFAFLIYFLFRSSDSKSGLWLVYVGTLSSATFGANLLGSPTAWVLIALYFRYGPMMAKKRRRNSKVIVN